MAGPIQFCHRSPACKRLCACLERTARQHIHDEGGGAQDACLVVFEGGKLETASLGGALLQLLANFERAFLEVDTIPCQPQCFGFTQAGKENYFQNISIIVVGIRCGEIRLDLFVGKRHDLRFLDAGEVVVPCRVDCVRCSPP